MKLDNACVLNIFMIYSFESTWSDLAISDQAFSSQECISLPISLAGKSKNADKSGSFLIFLVRLFQNIWVTVTVDLLFPWIPFNSLRTSSA